MGGELREIVDAAQIGRIFALCAILLPVCGLLLGAWFGKRRQQMQRGAITGLLIGLLGPLNWLMWRIYNAITDAVGLDRVSNLAINLLLFLIVGALIGIGAGMVRHRFHPSAESEAPDSHTQ